MCCLKTTKGSTNTHIEHKCITKIQHRTFQNKKTQHINNQLMLFLEYFLSVLGLVMLICQDEDC